MKDKIEALLASHDVMFSFVFVPWSKYECDRKQPYGLAWDVTLTQGRRTYTTRFSRGAAHLLSWPKGRFSGRMSLDEDAECRRESETGRHGKHPVATPSVVDVLACLASDASAIDHATFDEWANEYGYDPDSRKAEATYKACLACGLALRNMLGEAGLVELREIVREW